MTVSQSKIILQEFERLGLEVVDGLNLLQENGVISDNVILFGEVANEDGPAAIEFLRKYNLTDDSQK